jgi:hypothetical protein
MKGRALRSVQMEAWSAMAGWVTETPVRRAFGRGPGGGAPVTEESDRTRLIGDISRLIREPQIPESTRSAGLELIGWLARRMPGESAHAVGVEEARESQRIMRAARRKAR